MDCSPPGSLVCGVFQARILQQGLGAGDLSRPRDQTHISRIAGGFFTTAPPGKPCLFIVQGPVTCLAPDRVLPPRCQVSRRGVWMEVCYTRAQVAAIFFRPVYILSFSPLRLDAFIIHEPLQLLQSLRQRWLGGLLWPFAFHLSPILCLKTKV